MHSDGMGEELYHGCQIGIGRYIAHIGNISVCNRLLILHIGRYISAVMLKDTDISVLPIWAISADTDMPTLVNTYLNMVSLSDFSKTLHKMTP